MLRRFYVVLRDEYGKRVTSIYCYDNNKQLILCTIRPGFDFFAYKTKKDKGFTLRDHFKNMVRTAMSLVRRK